MVNGRKQASGHRIAGIDILRISLAFLIYLFHSRIHVLCDYGFFNDFIQSGSLAMSVFFMLSGYSLQLAYGQKNLSTKDNIIDFYLRRFISIYPLYIVTGTLFVLMNIVVGKQTVLDNILLFPVELSCLQAMFSGSLFEFAHNSGTWFISCLAICYTIFPLIHILLSNTSKNTQILFLSLSLLLIMYSPYIANKFCEDDLYTNPLFRTMEFVIGALISQINISVTGGKYLNCFRNRKALLISCIILIIGISLNHHYNAGFASLISSLCFTIIILALGHLTMPKLFYSNAIIYLSKITYAFFLAQFFIWNPAKFIIQYLGRPSNFVLITLTFTFCFTISFLLHEFVENKCSQYLHNKFINHDIRHT